ncbi:hypothetical protein Tco_1220884, partial [Tanacetum coccineum]
VTMELPYMFVERRGLTVSGAINSYRGRVVTNGYGTTVLISTVFGRLRDMLMRNSCSNFAPRTGELPICRPPPVTTRSPYMFVESLGLTGSGATNSSDGRVETKADKTTVPISTVFGRFKDMLVSNAKADFTAHTSIVAYSLWISDYRRCISPVVSSGSSFPLVNHAYLCLDVGTRTIRHHIINFCPSNANVPSNGAIPLNSSTAVNSEVIKTDLSSHAEFLPAYMDLGDCDCECHHCGGLFWYNECLKGQQYSRHPEYHLCCGRGKFYMHSTPDPPAFIQQLLINSHFMENIRAYNQMFAMTSFGAKVDESVNRGMGPYVFKISGQIYHWIGSLYPEDGNHLRFLQMYIYDTNNEVNNRMRHFGGLDAPGLNLEIVEGLIHVLDEHNGLVRLFRTARDRCNAGEIPGFKIKLYNLGGVRGYELPTSAYIEV